MDVLSTTKFARISARKARDVTREIQGLPVGQALDILTFTQRKAAHLIGKTMKTAMADAENNFELNVDQMYVKEATVGEGPTFKRFKPRARGSASAIRKRTAHIRIILSDELPFDKDDTERAPSKNKKAAKSPEKAAKPAKSEAPAKEEKAEKNAKAAASASSDEGRVDEKLGVVYDSAPSDVDDLKLINGVGPVLEDKLHEIGVYKFEQIANWDADQIAAFDDLLSFKGRIERDEWVAKAKDLANA